MPKAARNTAQKTKKKPTRKAPAAKAKKVAKAKPKKSLKTKAPQKKTATRKSQPPTPGTNVMWKLLEMKKARHKEAHAEGEKHHLEKDQGRFNSRHQNFSRFAGPRRRAA